jgi:D-cysteine desulfhydrase family pyridoxal phosphate-dependent enzyme
MDNRIGNFSIIDNILEQREKFAFLPTSLHKLENLTKELGGPNIYIKRDDNTGLALGGNKTRKLEYLMHHAINQKNNPIITIGAPQSNHCRQVAAACNKFKLECHLVLVGQEEKDGNILLDHLLDSKVKFIQDEKDAYQYVEKFFLEERNKNNNPLFIPAGGSNIIGVNGYVNAFREILNQEKELGLIFDYIIFASSSYGSHAGLVVGKTIFDPNTDRKLVGISICKSFLDSESNLTPLEKIYTLSQDYLEKYNLNFKIDQESIILDERFNNLGYGILSKDDVLGIKLMAKLEGIIVDPVYSGRAAGAMISMIKNQEINEKSNVLFIHTGGTPALFTSKYQNILET